MEIPEFKDYIYYHKACQIAKSTVTYRNLDDMNLVEASCPTFVGCRGWGCTKQEALADFIQGLGSWLTISDESGQLPKLFATMNHIRKPARKRTTTI